MTNGANTITSNAASGTTITIGGIIGSAGDLIVDSVEAPRLLLGRCDGRGGVVPLSENQRDRYESLLKIGEEAGPGGSSK